MATEYVLDADKIAHWRIDNHVPLKQLARAAGVNLSSLSHAICGGREVKMNLLLNLANAMGEDPRGHREAQSTCKSGDKMRFEIIERHIIDVPDSELTDGGRPLGEMTLTDVLDVIAENPHRFIEQYEVYCEEVIRLGGKL